MTVYQTFVPSRIDPDVLAEAQALLAAMPLDAPREPGGLPPGSRLPFVRNRLFVGRGPDLGELAYRYGRCFAGGVFWIACEDPVAKMAACGRGLHADFAGLPLET